MVEHGLGEVAQQGTDALAVGCVEVGQLKPSALVEVSPREAVDVLRREGCCVQEENRDKKEEPSHTRYSPSFTL